MTIDVEDYFHVHAFKDSIDRADWPTIAPRVENNTYRLLDLFAETGTRATFFTLGCVAARHPQIVRRIVAEGHELASHGWDHWAVFEQHRETFKADVTMARDLLEDVGGVRVAGYRAPSFSIDARSPWAYDVLAEAGYTYSSSSHPIRHDAYGDPSAERGPHRDNLSGLIEIPVTTVRYGKRRAPAGGGGFFRLFPLGWFQSAHRRARREGLTPNFYLHPWEIDPSQPRVKGAPLRSRFRHYVGLSRCEAKLRRLLQESGPWTRMDEAYDGWLRSDCSSGDRCAGNSRSA